MNRIGRRLLLALAVTVVAVAGWAAPAFAHAQLLSTDPASGSVLNKSPGTIVLHFGEDVEIQFGAVRVFDSNSKRVDDGDSYHPNGDGHAVAVKVPSSLSAGGYVVTWRVISADSHPVHGAFTFLIGTGGANAATAAKTQAAHLLAATGGSVTVGVVFGVVRFAAFAALFVLIGGAAFVAGAWPEGRDDKRTQWLLRAGLVGAIATTLLAIALQGPYGGGLPLAKALSPTVFREVLKTRFGEVYLARLVILAVAAAPLLRQLLSSGPLPRWWRAAGGATGAFILVTPGLAGHAATGSLVALAIPFDLVHISAAAVWVGGLCVLAVAVLVPRSDRQKPNPLKTVLPRYSQWALVAVLALAVSGGFAAWRQIGTLSAVTTTTYGRLVLAKTIIFVILVAVATKSRGIVHGSLALPFGLSRRSGVPAPAATKVAAGSAATANATVAAPSGADAAVTGSAPTTAVVRPAIAPTNGATAAPDALTRPDSTAVAASATTETATNTTAPNSTAAGSPATGIIPDSTTVSAPESPAGIRAIAAILDSTTAGRSATASTPDSTAVPTPTNASARAGVTAPDSPAGEQAAVTASDPTAVAANTGAAPAIPANMASTTATALIIAPPTITTPATTTPDSTAAPATTTPDPTTQDPTTPAATTPAATTPDPTTQDPTTPATTAPADTAPADTAPAATAPDSTAPGAPTAPGATAPADTAPADTAPDSTAPGAPTAPTATAPPPTTTRAPATTTDAPPTAPTPPTTSTLAPVITPDSTTVLAPDPTVGTVDPITIPATTTTPDPTTLTTTIVAPANPPNLTAAATDATDVADVSGAGTAMTAGAAHVTPLNASAERPAANARIDVPAGSPAGGERLSPGPGAMAAAPPKKRATWGAPQSRAVRRRTSGQRQTDLRKAVGLELLLVTVIIALTAVLVNAEPAREALSVPFSAEVHAGPSVLVDVVVDPAKAGPVAIHLYTLSPDGSQLDVPEVDATMSLPSAGISDLTVPLQKGGTGHFLVGGFDVPLKGTWTMNITVRTTAFNEFYATPLAIHMR